MLENKRVQKLHEFWISIAYFRASTVFPQILTKAAATLDEHGCCPIRLVKQFSLKSEKIPYILYQWKQLPLP